MADSPTHGFSEILDDWMLNTGNKLADYLFPATFISFSAWLQGEALKAGNKQACKTIINITSMTMGAWILSHSNSQAADAVACGLLGYPIASIVISNAKGTATFIAENYHRELFLMYPSTITLWNEIYQELT